MSQNSQKPTSLMSLSKNLKRQKIVFVADLEDLPRYTINKCLPLMSHNIPEKWVIIKE